MIDFQIQGLIFQDGEWPRIYQPYYPKAIKFSLGVSFFDAGLTIDTLWQIWHHMKMCELKFEISPTMLPCLWCARWWSMTWGILRCSKGDGRVEGFGWSYFLVNDQPTLRWTTQFFSHLSINDDFDPTISNRKLWCYDDWFRHKINLPFFCHFVCHQWGSMILSSLCCRVSRTGHD